VDLQLSSVFIRRHPSPDFSLPRLDMEYHMEYHIIPH
jgi:hypothetical protein